MVNPLYPIIYQAIKSDSGAFLIQNICYNTSIEQFEQLREQYPDFKFENESGAGYTVLQKSIACRNFELIEHLLNNKNNFNLELNSSLGTALEMALVKLYIPAIDLLIKSGANISNMGGLSKI